LIVKVSSKISRLVFVAALKIGLLLISYFNGIFCGTFSYYLTSRFLSIFGDFIGDSFTYEAGLLLSLGFATLISLVGVVTFLRVGLSSLVILESSSEKSVLTT